MFQNLLTCKSRSSIRLLTYDQEVVSLNHRNIFFQKILEDMSPFCWTSGDVYSTSKPEWATLFALGRGVHVTCSLRLTSGATPADLLAVSMAAKPSLRHTYETLIRLKTRSYHATAHSVRSGRRSTDQLSRLR